MVVGTAFARQADRSSHPSEGFVGMWEARASPRRRPWRDVDEG
jgi:hypothetical protein